MRRAKDPNHPPGGSTKVNVQDPTRPRKVDANLMIQADEDDASEQDNTDHHGDDWKTDDTLVFLSRFGDNDPAGQSFRLSSLRLRPKPRNCIHDGRYGNGFPRT